jgi:hypothetical protein
MRAMSYARQAIDCRMCYVTISPRPNDYRTYYVCGISARPDNQLSMRTLVWTISPRQVLIVRILYVT